MGKSNFKNIDPTNTNQQVVLCLDNDGKNHQTDQLIHLAVEKLQEQGKLVMIAQPKQEGWDFNNVLVREDLLAVKTGLQQAIPYVEYQDKTNHEIGANIGKGRSTSINKNPPPIKETAKVEKSLSSKSEVYIEI